MNIDLKGKNIAVLGFGVEGVSSLKFLLKQGAKVRILDKDQGERYLEGLNKYDVIVRSPGVKRGLPQLLDAEQKGVIITSQTKLFFDFCPCSIIGVTGTKGKGTTTSIIYEMLIKQGFDAYIGGNIGKPPLDFLDKLSTQSKVVLELSSFQLQDITKSPHIGVVLMITSEHLDYHKDVYEYVDAKRNIIRFQTASDAAIINKDYSAGRESDVETAGKVFNLSRNQEVERGAFVKDDAVWIRLGGKSKKIIDAKDILLPGRHNLENVCAAVMASALSGVTVPNMVSVLKSFKGLEHRLELVRTANGVRYYDDSFSTTPETAIAAIEAFDAPEILILGGSSKGSDFTELGRVISSAKNIKAIIGIGVEWHTIKSKIKMQNSKIKIIEGLKNMQEIVRKASEIAKEGDVVLLSPACASFDMFKNYKDRGDQFGAEIEKHRKAMLS